MRLENYIISMLRNFIYKIQNPKNRKLKEKATYVHILLCKFCPKFDLGEENLRKIGKTVKASPINYATQKYGYLTAHVTFFYCFLQAKPHLVMNSQTP